MPSAEVTIQRESQHQSLNLPQQNRAHDHRQARIPNVSFPLEALSSFPRQFQGHKAVVYAPQGCAASYSVPRDLLTRITNLIHVNSGPSGPKQDISKVLHKAFASPLLSPAAFLTRPRITATASGTYVDLPRPIGADITIAMLPFALSPSRQLRLVTPWMPGWLSRVSSQPMIAEGIVVASLRLER